MDNNNQENDALGILGGEHPLMGVVALAAFQEVVKLRDKLAEAEDRIRELTDVAKEIIADIVKFADDKERQMSFHGHSVWIINADDVTDFIAELKKKYTEGEK